jgi:hypothetical protein
MILSFLCICGKVRSRLHVCRTMISEDNVFVQDRVIGVVRGALDAGQRITWVRTYHVTYLELYVCGAHRQHISAIMQRDVRELVRGEKDLKAKRRNMWLNKLEKEVSRLHPDEGFDAAVVSERHVRYWPLPGDDDEITPLAASAVSGTMFMSFPVTPPSSSTSVSQNNSPSSAWSPLPSSAHAMDEEGSGSKRRRA